MSWARVGWNFMRSRNQSQNSNLSLSSASCKRWTFLSLNPRNYCCFNILYMAPFDIFILLAHSLVVIPGFEWMSSSSCTIFSVTLTVLFCPGGLRVSTLPLSWNLLTHVLQDFVVGFESFGCRWWYSRHASFEVPTCSCKVTSSIRCSTVRWLFIVSIATDRVREISFTGCTLVRLGLVLLRVLTALNASQILTKIITP